jgi:NAD(P)-dependent dehydrogenase (short-subunit alcohol dehydrogenase family)
MSQRILISGAASGLGLALARRYADAGWRVFLTDVDVAALDQAVASLGGGDRILSQTLDVRSADDWVAARDRCVAEWDGLDVLINNAGVATGGGFARTPIEDWDWIIDINLKGVIRGAATFVPLFTDQGHGHVVNVASLAGLINPPLMASYNVVKAAVVSLSETLRFELEPAGITTSVVCPSFFRTGLAGTFRTPDPAVRQLMERLVTASDIPAERIAATIQQKIAAKRFLILTDRDGRVAYAVKRFLPPLFNAMVRRRGKRLLDRVSAANPPAAPTR